MDTVKIDPAIYSQGTLFMFKETSPEIFKIFHDGNDIVCMKGEEILDFANDHETFYKDAYLNDKMREFFGEFPEFYLTGCYEDGKFVCTDVWHVDEQGTHLFQNFEVYHQFLAHYNVHYRMPVCRFTKQEDDRYIVRVMDSGTWHLKNYDAQLYHNWKIWMEDERE